MSLLVCNCMSLRVGVCKCKTIAKLSWDILELSHESLCTKFSTTVARIFVIFLETFKWHHAMYAENVGTYIANVATCVSKNESQETFVIACQNMFVLCGRNSQIKWKHVFPTNFAQKKWKFAHGKLDNPMWSQETPSNVPTSRSLNSIQHPGKYLEYSLPNIR